MKKNIGDQDDKISLTCSFLCLRRRLLILKILGIDLIELIHTHTTRIKREMRLTNELKLELFQYLKLSLSYISYAVFKAYAIPKGKNE